MNVEKRLLGALVIIMTGDTMRVQRTRRNCRALCILVLTLGFISPTFAVEDIWMTKADMPTARFFFATSVMDGKIYAIGGASAPHVSVSTVEVYDPATDSWATRASIPAARSGVATAAVDGRIYAIGGGVGARTTFEYDPGTDTWARKADMPTGRSFLTTSVVGGQIYAIGGATDTSGPAFTAVEEYNPATDTWTRKADMPERRFMHTAGVVDGKIYIIAGSWQSYTASPAVFGYDPASDMWERKADAPTARSWLSPSAGVVNGRIYVFGGDFGPPRPNVEEYDPVTDTWTTRPDMPTPRGGLATIAVDDSIYVIGGLTTLESPSLSTVEAYSPNPLMVDFNADGVVDVKDLLRLVESWGQSDAVCDIAPRPFGDGTVDAADLKLLMDYWGLEIQDGTLAAHWPLDETDGMIAFDSTGSHHAEVVGDPLWRPDGGVAGGALELDGTTLLAVDSILNPSDGPFSVFAWVNGGAPGQIIVSQNKGADWVGIDPVLRTLMSDLKSEGRFSKPLYSDAIITDGAWHSVGFSWNGNNRSLYVDDVLVAEDTDIGLAECDGGLNMGCGNDMAPSTFFTGRIDDVRVYNRAVQP